MPKFFVEDNQIRNETIDIIGDDVNHIVNVLRLKKDDVLLVCNKDTGVTYQTKIEHILKEKVECKMIEKVAENVESKVEVTIFQGLPKAEKMEYIIQKSTELGVKTIVPVALKRCIVKLDGKDSVKKIQRWQKIAEVAAKQSKRDRIPKINLPIIIKNIYEKIKNYDIVLVAYENEDKLGIKEALKELNKKEKIKVAIVVGPEGGIDEKEIELLKSLNTRIITLGKRILRTETAPIVLSSVIMYEFNQMI